MPLVYVVIIIRNLKIISIVVTKNSFDNNVLEMIALSQHLL